MAFVLNESCSAFLTDAGVSQCTDSQQQYQLTHNFRTLFLNVSNDVSVA